jgi:SAM-dependent methyltransferase
MGIMPYLFWSSFMVGKDISCPVCGSIGARVISRDRFNERNRYFRCSACGCGFSALRVYGVAETADIHTSAYYAPEHEEFREVPAAEAFFLARLLALKSAGRLLDVGCGRGRWLRYIRDHSAFDVEGVEPSGEAAEYARKERGLEVRTGDLASAGYPDAVFDVVYLRNVLEHVAAPHELVREVGRILKPDSICAVHVPNDASITNALKRALYRAGCIRECGSLFFPLHVTGFTSRSLDLLFRGAGFLRIGLVAISKIQRIYEFPLTPLDIPLLSAALLEYLSGRGNLLVGWYERA